MGVHPANPVFFHGGHGLKFTEVGLMVIVLDGEIVVLPQFGDAPHHNRRRVRELRALAALDDCVLDPRGLAAQLPLRTGIQGTVLMPVVCEELVHTEVDVATSVSTAMQ